MEIIDGRIEAVQPGYILIRAAYDNMERFVHREYDEVQIALQDGRTITPRQRRLAYALINAISEYSGNEPEWTKINTKHDFIRDHLKGLRKELFSLSNCDETTASEYIAYLIELCIEYGVPTEKPLVDYAEDISRYVYACAKRKTCCVCGTKADLHHVDRVGMGRNRDEINHIGMECLPLCRIHHQEAHSIGDDEFCYRYHIVPVEIDETIAKANNLRRRA